MEIRNLDFGVTTEVLLQYHERPVRKLKELKRGDWFAWHDSHYLLTDVGLKLADPQSRVVVNVVTGGHYIFMEDVTVRLVPRVRIVMDEPPLS